MRGCFIALSIVLLSVPALAQTAQRSAVEQAAVVEFARKAAVRALDYSQGDLESMIDAQSDFTADGWREFMKRMDGWLDANGAPLGSSSFTPAGDPIMTRQENGVFHLTIPGTLKQTENKSNTTYQVVVNVQAGGSPLKILHLEPTVQVKPLAAGDKENSKNALLATYKLLEKAVETGDGNLYLSLQSQKKLDKTGKQAQEQFLKGFPADASARYDAIAVKLRSDHAAILGRVSDSSRTSPQHYLAKFVLENGSWKIAQDELSDKPIDPSALEAAVPPKDGAFTRAGSPWNTVPLSATNTKWFKEAEVDWKMQATQDESFLYFRFVSKVSLPRPETEIPAEDAKAFKGTPSAPNVLVIQPSSGREFTLVLGANPMTRATFDESGRATSNRYFVQYSLSLKNAAGEMLFSDGTNESFEPLIAVQDRFLDVKIPLRCLGIQVEGARIGIREANSLAKMLPYSVAPFSK